MARKKKTYHTPKTWKQAEAFLADMLLDEIDPYPAGKKKRDMMVWEAWARGVEFTKDHPINLSYSAE